jgi:hypothetical protein
MEAWEHLAFPVYTRRIRDPLAALRGIRRREVNLWFAWPDGEGGTFNLAHSAIRQGPPGDSPLLPWGLRSQRYGASTLRRSSYSKRLESDPEPRSASCELTLRKYRITINNICMTLEMINESRARLNGTSRQR